MKSVSGLLTIQNKKAKLSRLLFGCSTFEEGLYEGFLVEYLELVDAFANADKADRDLELI